MPELLIAHHPVVSALPFFAPMLVIVAFLLISRVVSGRDERPQSAHETH